MLQRSAEEGIVQIWVYRTVLSLYFSVNSDRKVPKEHRQRAGRPLDTRFSYMGLFDRGYTRRGIRKALRKRLRRRFSHDPPNSTPSRCAAIVAVVASPLLKARPAIRQTPYLPAEKKGEFRTDGAPPSARVLGSWRLSARSGSFAPPWAKEPRGSGRWKAFFWYFSVDMDRKVHSSNRPINCNFTRSIFPHSA